MIPMPLWLLLAGGIGLSLSSGFAGWKVENWRLNAKIADMQLEALAEGAKLQAQVAVTAARYETLRAINQEQKDARAGAIRTIYRNVPAPPVECAPPPAAVGVLRSAIAAANARAAGQPRPIVQ